MISGCSNLLTLSTPNLLFVFFYYFIYTIPNSSGFELAPCIKPLFRLKVNLFLFIRIFAFHLCVHFITFISLVSTFFASSIFHILFYFDYYQRQLLDPERPRTDHYYILSYYSQCIILFCVWLIPLNVLFLPAFYFLHISLVIFSDIFISFLKTRDNREIAL